MAEDIQRPGSGPGPGLCARCAWSRQVESARGSVFWLCRRSEFDERYRKYPPLPVVRCEGHEPEQP
jgi:hypothetical protein